MPTAAAILRERLLAAPKTIGTPLVVWPMEDSRSDAAQQRYFRALTAACEWLVRHL